MTRSRLSGCSMRTHNSPNPRLEGCHLFHRTGTPGAVIGIYSRSSVIPPLKYNHYKVFLQLSISAFAWSTRRKEMEMERQALRSSGWRAPRSNVNISFTRAGACCSARHLRRSRNVWGLNMDSFWCLPGIDIRATLLPCPVSVKSQLSAENTMKEGSREAPARTMDNNNSPKDSQPIWGRLCCRTLIL